MTLNISDTQHNNALPCADVIMLNFAFSIMPSVNMLSVIVVNVVMLSVVASLRILEIK